MTPELRKMYDRSALVERERLQGYTVASTCNWRYWRLSEAVWWATGKITPEAVEIEWGEDADLVTEQYRAFLEGGNFAWGQMLKVLAMRHCHSRTRPRPCRLMSVYEFMGFLTGGRK